MRTLRLIAPLLAGLALAACGSSNKGNVSVALKTAPTTQAVTGGADLKNGIVLSEVRMVVRKIVLFPTAQPQEPKPTPTEMDEDRGDMDDQDEHPHSTFGPFPVDIGADTLSGGIPPAFDASVDKGTYAGARVVVNTVKKDAQPTDTVLQGMQKLHASIAIDGTIDSKSFEFVTPMRVAQWKKGPITVGDGTTNLTLDVDPTGWFTPHDSNKTRLDPTDPNDRGEILENIRCSIRMFEDEDHDGKPDDGDENEPEGCQAPTAPAAG